MKCIAKTLVLFNRLNKILNLFANSLNNSWFVPHRQRHDIFGNYLLVHFVLFALEGKKTPMNQRSPCKAVGKSAIFDRRTEEKGTVVLSIINEKLHGQLYGN